MTQILTQAFANHHRLNDADSFLSDLADRLESEIHRSERRKDRLQTSHYTENNKTYFSPALVFSHPSLEQVTQEEVSRMKGFAKLKEVLANPRIDMSLGKPFARFKPAEKFGAIEIFVELPYSVSGPAIRDAIAKDRAAKNNPQKKAQL